MGSGWVLAEATKNYPRLFKSGKSLKAAKHAKKKCKSHHSPESHIRCKRDVKNSLLSQMPERGAFSC